MGEYLSTKYTERITQDLIINKKNLIKRIIRKGKKILHQNDNLQDPELARRRAARTQGRKLHLKRNGFIFKCSTLKPAFYLPLFEKDYIQQKILTEGTYYEYANLNYICKEWNNGVISQNIKEGCILDIGANIGNHTLYFFFECGIKKAICFEPIESTYNILKRNLEINDIIQNVSLVKSAVGASNGTASISHYDISNIGSTQISLNNSGDITVMSIDSMHIENNINLVKIDVEGFEKDVIDGSKETLAKCKPYIMIEIQPENFDYISNELSKMGYKYTQLTGINYLF